MRFRMIAAVLAGLLAPASIFAEPVVINQGLSPELKRIVVKLNWTEDLSGTAPRSFSGQNYENRIEPSEAPFTPRAAKRSDTSAYSLARLQDGTEFWLFVMNDTNPLGQSVLQHGSSEWWGQIYRRNGRNHKLVDEGTFGTGGAWVRETITPAWSDTPMPAFVGFTSNGTVGGAPMVVPFLALGGSYTGTAVENGVKLEVSIQLQPQVAEFGKSALTITSSSLSGGLDPTNLHTKLGANFSVGSAGLITESFDPVSGDLTFAVTSGRLEPVGSQLLPLGSEIPSFSQVDLLRRQTVTERELVEAASKSGWLVLVFGNFDFSNSRQMGYGGNSIPKPEVIQRTLGLDLSTPPTLAVVSSRVTVEMLYGDYVDKDPDWFLLADPLDPRWLQLLSETSQGFFGESSSASVRSLFAVPLFRCAVMVFDGEGKLRFAEVSNGDKFLGALQSANAVMRGKATK